MWGQDNNLSLNVSKTKELIVDYRKRWAEQAPINIDRAVVERVESFKKRGTGANNNWEQGKTKWSKSPMGASSGKTRNNPGQILTLPKL